MESNNHKTVGPTLLERTKPEQQPWDASRKKIAHWDAVWENWTENLAAPSGKAATKDLDCKNRRVEKIKRASAIKEIGGGKTESSAGNPNQSELDQQPTDLYTQTKSEPCGKQNEDFPTARSDNNKNQDRKFNSGRMKTDSRTLFSDNG
jgi:hypothetical protein